VKTKENDILTYNNAYEDLKKDYDVMLFRSVFMFCLEKVAGEK